MTCIAAAVDTLGRVWMGADSAAVCGLDLTVRSDAKVFGLGFGRDRLVIGYTTSFRMGQLLRYGFQPPPLPAYDDSLLRYMVVDFVEAVRSRLKAGGFTETANGRETAGHFLVGVRGRLFGVEPDFQVGEAAGGYDAVGCGAAYAKGSLYTTADLDLTAQQRLTLALEAAERHSAGVRGPFETLST